MEQVQDQQQAEAPVLSIASLQATDFASLSGSPKSPNLPFGEWEWVLNETPNEKHAGELGNLIVTEERTRDTPEGEQKYDFNYAQVRSAGNPNATPRRVYIGAIIAPSAATVLFNNGKLKKSFKGGIYTEAGASIVSTDPTKVSKGIAAANTAYSNKVAADKAKKDEAQQANA